jgi:putative transposase
VRRVRPTPKRALSRQERQQALDLLHSPRFADSSPAQIYATLLDEGHYLCSIRTLYRLLHSHHEVRERRNQLRHPSYQRPELLATAPQQVWSWDITKLRGPIKGSHYSLYVILDIYSRYVVGWLVAEGESKALAERLIRETLTKYSVAPGQLTLHADRGACMTAQTLTQLLAQLEVAKSHSRPHTSNDNPYSEAQFKTLKYCPQFPQRFDSIHEARAFCRRFFSWYNHQHRHSGIALLTPADVHFGRARQVLQQRTATLTAAYKAHPERFSRPPVAQPLPEAVWINSPDTRAPAPSLFPEHALSQRA